MMRMASAWPKNWKPLAYGDHGLANALYPTFVPYLSAPFEWEAFLRIDDSKFRALIHLHLRARTLLFEKSCVSLSPQSFSIVSPSAVSKLNTVYLKLHGDDVYFTLESDSQDAVRQRDGVAVSNNSSSTKIQSKTVFRVGSKYSESEMESPLVPNLDFCDLYSSFQMSNYSSMDGVLYCKTHFEQLFKESGNFSKNFQPSAAKSSEKQNELSRAPSRVSSMFSGTQDKCATCQKTVYPLEKVTMEEEIFHKSCFKCAHGGCPLTHSSYAKLDGVLYCKHHFAQLFMEKGNYSHVLKAVTDKKQATAPSEAKPELESEPTEQNTKAEGHDPEHSQEQS